MTEHNHHKCRSSGQTTYVTNKPSLFIPRYLSALSAFDGICFQTIQSGIRSSKEMNEGF